MPAIIMKPRPTGNKVSLEEQMTKMADTGMEFQTITNLYRKHIAMMKMALGRGNG
jgi:flagellar basal-body rod protein FlgB